MVDDRDVFYICVHVLLLKKKSGEGGGGIVGGKEGGGWDRLYMLKLCLILMIVTLYSTLIVIVLWG
mgnify:CR=1 FL=1